MKPFYLDHIKDYGCFAKKLRSACVGKSIFAADYKLLQDIYEEDFMDHGIIMPDADSNSPAALRHAENLS